MSRVSITAVLERLKEKFSSAIDEIISEIEDDELRPINGDDDFFDDDYDEEDDEDEDEDVRELRRIQQGLI